MSNFVLESIAPPAAPQWLDRLKAEGAQVVVMVLPVGWVGTWHENPKPQWIIPLSGRWFVETMDGARVEMGPGELSFGEDQNTKLNSKGEKGHLSGTVGNEPAVLMVIQLKDAPTVNRQCHFK
jgi:quercetin dioxygenase-like cupin family protein